MPVGCSSAGSIALSRRAIRRPDPGQVPVWSPYVRGERTPYHDPDRRAVLAGLNLAHDAASVRRAAYEASGFVVRQLIELGAAPVSRIVATGGGTRVEPWMQAIADATGHPVEVSGVPEGAALGAAFLGRMAAGLESSIADAKGTQPPPPHREPRSRRAEPPLHHTARARTSPPPPTLTIHHHHPHNSASSATRSSLLLPPPSRRHSLPRITVRTVGAAPDRWWRCWARSSGR